MYKNLRKLAETVPPVGHVFVTGHSGSGKTTLARQLKDKLGLPVYTMDDDPYMLAHKIKRRQVDKHKPLFPPGDEEARQVILNIFKNIQKLKEPHIVEGAQIAHAPEFWPGNRLIYVDLPERQLVRQRLKRDREQGEIIPPGSAAARRRAEKAKDFMRAMNKALQQVAAYPEVERMRAEREYTRKL